MLSSRLPDELKLVAHPAGGRRPRCSQDPRGILGTLAEPTGTDGFRLLCHQFFLSSLSRRETCLTSSKAFWLKMKKRREALSSDTGSQARAKVAGSRSSRFPMADCVATCA